MNILRIVLQTILFSYLTAANASVRDEYLRRESVKEIYKNLSFRDIANFTYICNNVSKFH